MKTSDEQSDKNNSKLKIKNSNLLKNTQKSKNILLNSNNNNIMKNE